MSTEQLEERVATLEIELAELKSSLAHNAPSSQPWWERICGTFADDADFDEAVQLGREYRESLRSRADNSSEG